MSEETKTLGNNSSNSNATSDGASGNKSTSKNNTNSINNSITNKENVETDAVKVKMDTNNKREKCKPMTKVVVRRLPPSMTQSQFIEQVSPLPDHDYLYFVKADTSLGQHAFSRAYINFIVQQDIFIFREKFDNYVFVDAKGSEYPAVVEFAPFQRLPKKRVGRKKDPKCGTIESDHYYINFIESLKSQDSESTSSQPKTEYSYQPFDNAQKKITTTPLIEYLKQRKAEKQRIKDEKREERRRRDLERRRIKDEPTVSKVLRNPDADGSRENKENKDEKDKISPKEVKNRNKRDDKISSRDKMVISRDSKNMSKNYRDRDDKKDRYDRDSKNMKKHDDKKVHNKRDDRESNYQREDKKYEGKNYHKDDRRGENHRGDNYFHQKEKTNEEKKGKSYEKMRQEKRRERMNESKKDGIDESTTSAEDSKVHQQKIEPSVLEFAAAVAEKLNQSSRFTSKRTINDDNKDASKFTNTNNSSIQIKSASEMLRNTDDHEKNADSEKIEDSKSSINQIKTDSVDSEIEKISKSAADLKLDPLNYKITEIKTRNHEKIGENSTRNPIKSGKMSTKRRSSLESGGETNEGNDANSYLRRHKSLDGGDEDNLQKNESDEKDKDKKDPRLERRIRNKDRPAMEIYRPGMGKFSKQRLEREKSNHDDRASLSQSPTPITSAKMSVAKNNSNNIDININNSSSVSSNPAEFRSMTFKRSASRDTS